MAAIQPPKWETSEAKELLEKDLLSGRISLQTTRAWTPKIIYNLPDRPQFRLYVYKIFRSNLLTLRNRIKAEKKAADTASLALTHDRVIYPLGAVNDQQGGAPRWAGSLAQTWLNADIEEGKHETMKPNQLRQTRLEYMIFEKDIFRKHIHQEVKTRKWLVYLKEKAEKAGKKKRG
jgi:hypothetical protein